jgi:hypothetical protein
LEYWRLRAQSASDDHRHDQGWVQRRVVCAQNKFRDIHDNRKLCKAVWHPAEALQHQPQLFHPVTHRPVQFRDGLGSKLARAVQSMAELKVFHQATVAIRHIQGQLTSPGTALGTVSYMSAVTQNTKAQREQLSGLVLSGLANKESFYWPKVMTPKMPLP